MIRIAKFTASISSKSNEFVQINGLLARRMIKERKIVEELFAECRSQPANP